MICIIGVGPAGPIRLYDSHFPSCVMPGKRRQQSCSRYRGFSAYLHPFFALVQT